MAEQEYELLPHQVLQDLKFEVEALKKRLSQPDAKINELLLELESLKDTTHELTMIFQKALEHVKEEDTGALLKTLNQKLQTVVTQNETIARGMVAIADKVDTWLKKQESAPKSAVSVTAAPGVGTASPQHQMAPPQAMAGQRMAPYPSFEAEGPIGPPMPGRHPLSPMAPRMPPPPPGPRKKGLFS